ncbi:MAG TPA: amino acid adenylation domain-containing protein [Candidatus Angelobacter sp.]|nr:amino acid adenylation domain-containing protein [Candidatus Angelobacter sp.]
MYRTGDLVRWRNDGMLEFVGRNDLQVKVRGFRIELSEIEARLLELNGVREAAVVAQGDGVAERRLVAYYVARHTDGAHSSDYSSKSNGHGQISVEELRGHLAQRLPDYMVPAAYVRLDAMPLTPTGKLDRKRLPAPDSSAYVVSGYEEPQGEIEKALAAIWQEVLGVGRVGRNDNFFELGGHSLLAISVVTRLRETLGLGAELSDIFEHPRLAELAGKIAGGERAELPPIAKADRSRPIPLSYAQQRLWFLAQMQEASEVYHIPFGVGLVGNLNRRALGLALDRLVQRHEGLRTTFPMVHGEAVQRIAPPSESHFSLLDYDLRGSQSAAASSELRRLLDEEAHANFDLETGPLIRGRLIRQGENEHALLITMHHIVSDGWSMGVLLNELSVLYGALARGESDPLPELTVQYPDFAVWQRNWIQGDVLLRQSDYWKNTLSGSPTLLELPTDRARPAEQRYAGAMCDVALDEGLTAKLKQLSKEHGVTLYMTLLAGWAAMLGRLSGQQDILIGSPTANRGQGELEKLIGFFVNTLVLRVDLSGRPSVGELLKRVKGQSLGAQHHQDIPFEQVVEIVQPERSLAHSPLFQVMFAWQNAPKGSLDLLGLQVVGLETASHRVARSDLTASLWETGERIAGGVEYATALFESETVERFMEYWRRILEGMAAGSERIVDCLDILSEGERRQLLSEWNQTKAAYPQKCVHELFEEQVRTSPESVAIEAAGQRLTYRELNRRANQLARYLVRAGVGPEVRVGICMERGLEMVIGLLAILKAGGTYVPLDPNYPPERLKFMAEDSSIAALLTQSSLLNRLPESANTNTKTTISADSSLTEISRQSEENLGLPIPGESVAYVIYTSGSTGRPKGVAIRHSSANALLHWAREIYSSEDFVGVLASTSICFDLSVFEIFAPLSWGGKVIIVRDALALAEIGPETAVSLLNTVPSAMVELLRLKAVPESVRTVNLAGEALRPDLVAQIYRETKASRVFNLYGPSEDTTYSTFACLERGPAEEKVPIGKPIANTQAYVLDRELQPVPMGVTGELYLAGEGVARGYLNHPELAAERFLPNPFAEGSGERMYRTGDQARWGRDGNLEFLGRSDQQVKIRGYRIELGEIEAALQACEGVRSCVVIVREVGSEVRPEDRRLVAYIEREDTAKVHDYSSLLKSRLPDYMIPAAFVELEQLPLTANGKVDRKSLPAPEGEGIASGGYIGPRNAEEEMLSGLFAEVLNRDRIGVHDNFFAVGGHSLLATRLVSRIRTVLGINVPVRSVFESPTIAKLARLAARLQGASRSRTSLQRRVESGPALLSYSQQRLWFIDRLQGRSTEYNMAEALRLRGKLDVSALRRAVQAIVDRHEILRTQFGEVQGVPVQIVAPRLAVEIPVQDLSGLSSAEQQAQVAAFVNNEWSEPFDLATGQVLRLKLLKLAEEDHVLLRTFHHIVSDGWSLGVFMRELREFYDAYSQGMEISLPELPLQFADFAAWQNQEAKSGAQDEDLAFWKSHLAGAPQELDIPKDRPRPAMQTYVGKACGISLPAETVAGLRRSEHATLYMTLLAGFAVLMHRYSGQDDIVVGSPVANRSDERLEGLIGYFANTLVMRVKVNPTIAFSELVAEVRERALQGYRHQELPYERLLEELPLPRSLNRTPIFQVIFALQNAASQSAGAPAAVEAIQQLRGLDIEGIGNEAWTVRYDLEVHALEREGRLDIVWIYNQDLFDSWHIEQMARHYEQTLMAIPQSMRKPICDLGLLSESEAQQLITAEIRSGEPGKQIPLRAPADNLHLAPRTPMEQLLADTWRDILGLERLGLDDNFFDLGGYSLLLARVRFHLRQKLQKEIEFVDFFSYPTVRLLAEKLEHDGATGNSGAMR